MNTTMSHMGLHENLNDGLWPECVATATKLENIMVNPKKTESDYDKLYRDMLNYADYLRNFG